MRSDDGSAIFPYTRIRGQVALVGVNTAVPTPPFLASGRIGADQLSRLETQLLALKRQRSEEHTSELQSLMRISYAVFCLKKKKNTDKTHNQDLQSKSRK